MEIYNEILSKEHVLELLKEVLEEARKLQYLKEEMLNLEEAMHYLSLSKSKLYDKISNDEIPFYANEEKRILFRKSELDYWIFSGEVSTTENFDKVVSAFLSNITNF
jgi:excisionase family DNA binding protein